MKIGVLALQGAFREHLDTLAAIGVEGVRVREPADLEGVSGLILPGGESTTMRQLIERWGLRGPILDLARSGAPIYGTCAGMIVLSTDIEGGEEPVLPLLDVTVERNAFGRQLDSFETDLSVPVLGDTQVHAVFIRAPIIERTGPDVDVLARLDDGRVVAVRQRNVIATSFHPELAGETRFHRLVATMASGTTQARPEIAASASLRRSASTNAPSCPTMRAAPSSARSVIASTVCKSPLESLTPTNCVVARSRRCWLAAHRLSGQHAPPLPAEGCCRPGDKNAVRASTHL